MIGFKLNNKNKAVFLGNYLGCTMEYPEINDKISKGKLSNTGFDYIHIDYKRNRKGSVGVELGFKNNLWHNSNAINAKALLTPIAMITDEDLIQCYYISSQKIGYDYTMDFQPVNIMARHWIEMEGIKSVYKYSEQSDYLRSQGYAIPWNGISVDDMVEAGWIKLKKEKKNGKL